MSTPPTPVSGLADGAAAANKPSLKQKVLKGLKGSQSASNQATSAEHDLLSSARAATMAPPQMFHEGGKIKKDGVQVIHADEGETVLPNEDKEKALELAVDHLKGMSEGLSHKGKKKESAHKKETEKKKAHGFHAKKVKGGWHVHHHDENDKPIEGAEHVMPDDLDELHDHLEDHFGQPNPGEAEAEAGPPPMPAGGPAGA